MKRQLESDTRDHSEDACELRDSFEPKRARRSLEDTVVALSGTLVQLPPRAAVDEMSPLLQTLPKLAVEIQLKVRLDPFTPAAARLTTMPCRLTLSSPQIYQHLRPQDLYNLSLASKKIGRAHV